MTDTAFSSSYIITDTELETLIGNDPRTSAIALKAATAAAQGWYCAEATRHIDSLAFRGQKWDLTTTSGVPTQELEFPRLIDGVGVGNGDVYVLAPEIPDQVKRACLEEAIAIYQAGTSGGLKDLQEQGVSSMSIGGKLSYSFVPGAGQSGLLSAAAKRYLRKFLGGHTR